MILSDSFARYCAVSAALASTILAGCTTQEERERACFDKLAADFEQSRIFAGEQALAAPWGSDAAVSWQNYALMASRSALSISLIWTDDDRSACDYVSAGPELQRK